MCRFVSAVTREVLISLFRQLLVFHCVVAPSQCTWPLNVLLPCHMVHVSYRMKFSQSKIFANRPKGIGISGDRRQPAKRDWQRKLIMLNIDLYTLLAALCCASVFQLVIGNYRWLRFVFHFTTQHANVLEPWLTQHDNTMSEFYMYIFYISGKITKTLHLTLLEGTVWSVSKYFVLFSKHVEVLTYYDSI